MLRILGLILLQHLRILMVLKRLFVNIFLDRDSNIYDVQIKKNVTRHQIYFFIKLNLNTFII
jgi:hypothetical protein